MTPGRPWPLGAHCDGEGVNFAMFSGNADAVELCLFNAPDGPETARHPLSHRTGDVWHGFLPHARAGLIYAFRVHGTWNPRQGQRFNAAKLLLDPYARDIVGDFSWRDEHFAHNRQNPLEQDLRDNAAHALKARVIRDGFDWQGDELLQIPLRETILYEVHVK